MHTHTHRRSEYQTNHPLSDQHFFFLFHCGVIDSGAESNNTRAGDCMCRASLWCSYFFVLPIEHSLAGPACSANKICASGAFYSVTRRIEFGAPIHALLQRRRPVWLRLFTRFKTPRGQIELLINAAHRCWVGVLFRMPPHSVIGSLQKAIRLNLRQLCASFAFIALHQFIAEV